MIGVCCRCRRRVLTPCGECGALRPTPEYAQRGLRLSTLQHHVTPFCRTCVPLVTPEDYPEILANIRAAFETSWAQSGTPEIVRNRQRAWLGSVTILGWADEIPGLEHLVGQEPRDAA